MTNSVRCRIPGKRSYKGRHSLLFHMYPRPSSRAWCLCPFLQVVHSLKQHTDTDAALAACWSARRRCTP